MCLKIRKKLICASQIIFATMHYDLIIILCQQPKHAGQTIISKPILFSFKWYHEVLV